MAIPTPQPCDRSIDTRETPTAYRAFMDYCRMGTKRSLRALVQRYLVQPASNAQAEEPPTIYTSTLFGWSRRHDWQKRVRLWDTHQEHLKAEEHNKVIADMNRRHAQMGMIAQQKALAKLTSLSADGKTITVTEATRLMVEGSRTERLARGEPVTIETHEHRGPHGGDIPIKYAIVHLPPDEGDDAQDGQDGHDGQDGDDPHDGGDGSEARGQDSALDT